jgi:hypothetical protein
MCTSTYVRGGVKCKQCYVYDDCLHLESCCIVHSAVTLVHYTNAIKSKSLQTIVLSLTEVEPLWQAVQ